MRKIVLYIATSIDGLIAGENDDIKWLDNFPNPKKSDYGYAQFYDSIDTLLMGGRTFRVINKLVEAWPYHEKETYIISRQMTEDPTTPRVSLLGANWINEIRAIKEQKGKDIWIVGGGEILGELLKYNLVDKMIISHFPVLLGKGKRLFNNDYDSSNWELSRGKYFPNGVVQAEYVLLHK